MILDTIKLSQRGKEQLVQLKRRTGIKNWNILCRWALTTSLAEASVPPRAKIPTDSSVEMTWKVFGGEFADIYGALVKTRCIQDGLPTDATTLALYFRLHLHRGLGYLFADKSIQSIAALVNRAPKQAQAG